MNPLTLAQEIIDGRRITREDDLSFFLTCDLDELCEGADRIREACIGDKVDLCSIINGRSGRCPEDCKYCAQSAHHHTSCEVYNFLPEEKILEACKMNESEGVDRFSIVTAGKALTGKEFDQAIHAYETMHRECKIDLCASMGFISAEQLHRLHKAGVTSYHHNIETSRRNFPNICTTHTYDMKIETLKKVKAEGMCACSGGIIGMGETWEERLDMAELHLKGLAAWKGEYVAVRDMRAHASHYFHGLRKATELRRGIMKAQTEKEFIQLLHAYKEQFRHV